MAATEFTFAIGQDGEVEWYYPSGRPDLTEQQALVIATVRAATAMNNIANALQDIATAIRESRD